MTDEQQVQQGTVPTNAADATEEVNQQQAANQQQVAQPGEPGGPPSANPHAQGVQPAEPIRVPDERVATSPQNPVVGAGQPGSEPAKAAEGQPAGPDQNE